MHTGRGFIHFLSAWATGSNDFFFNIILKQIAVMHTPLKLLFLRSVTPKLII